MSYESRAGRVTIEVKATVEGSIWTLRILGGQPLVFENLLGFDRIAEQRQALRGKLKNLASAFENQSSSAKWRAITSALFEFHEKALEVAWQLFGDRWSDIQTLFEKTFPLWDSVDPPILDIVLTAADAGVIPLEFLPVFGRKKSIPRRICNLNSLGGFLRRFLGFSVLVSRTVPGVRVERCLTLDAKHKLPVKFFQHAGLRWARNEVRFFQANDSVVELDGPWPDKRLPFAKVVSTLAEQLRNPLITFAGGERGTAYQVQHFACHCDTQKSSSSDHSLRLANTAQTEYEVTIGGLQAEFAKLSGRTDFNGPKPLVFLNACGSAAIKPLAVSSFARFFLCENRNRGFIGVETDIDDQSAAAFSTEFYSFFLSGKTLGEAAHLSRWRLLNYYKNPSAFLYVVFADAGIHLEMSR